MSEARIKELEARVKELEDAIGVCVPSLLRVLLQTLPTEAVLDKEITEKVLVRVDEAMKHEKLTPSKYDIVSVYPCGACGRFVICEKGNHHPWCLHCMYDQFDWSGGHDKITREEAEKIVERGEL